MSADKIKRAIQSLLAGRREACEIDLLPMPGGANNRSYQTKIGSERLFCKVYHSSKNDDRDRGKTEYVFSTFAWGRGIRMIPEPLGYDENENVGLYQFIDGRKLTTIDLDQDAIQQAIVFFMALNRHKNSLDALALPVGSEACFDIASHINCVSKRIAQLDDIRHENDIDHEAITFVNTSLRPFWESIAAKFQFNSNTNDQPLEQNDRCVSPSDFGFHNTLRVKDNSLMFYDFEYAGWDDPAKMTCDFFCQVQTPAPNAFLEDFIDSISTTVSHPHLLRDRINLLLPVYRTKWCCILLNEFLSDGISRRRFSMPDEDWDERKAKQLTKAKHMLENMS